MGLAVYSLIEARRNDGHLEVLLSIWKLPRRIEHVDVWKILIRQAMTFQKWHLFLNDEIAPAK
jgi:hypothetical protein